MVTRTCACGCGRKFVARPTTKRHFEDSCRQRAYRLRKDPLIGSLARKRAQRDGLDKKYAWRVRGQIRRDLARLYLLSATVESHDEEADDSPHGSWDRVRQSAQKLGDGIKRYLEGSPPQPLHRGESYEPFSTSEDRRISGEPQIWVHPTGHMPELAALRKQQYDREVERLTKLNEVHVQKDRLSFPCRQCAAWVDVGKVLSHTCEQERVKVVTITEYRALDSKIDQLTEAMARVEETVCMVAARFASDEAVQAAVNEFLETFADDDTIAA